METESLKRHTLLVSNSASHHFTPDPSSPAEYTIPLANPYKNIVKAEWRSASPGCVGNVLSIAELNSNVIYNGAPYFCVVSTAVNAQPFTDDYPLNKVNIHRLTIRWLQPTGALAMISPDLSFEIDLWEA